MNLLACFLIGVLICYLVLSYKSGLESSELTTVVQNLNTKVIVLTRNLEEAKKGNKRLMEMQNLQTVKMSDVDSEIKSLNDHCEKLKLQQIEFKDKLSEKRPVLRIAQPIQIEVVEKGKGVKSLLQKAGVKQ